MRIKRVFDVVVSSAALVLLFPLLLFIAVLVRVSSPGPALFRQKRVGYLGKPFVCFKFRSMYEGSETIPGLVRDREDPRVTPIGRYIRRYHLDELPQLFNVVRGEMSLVGPRPRLETIVAGFSSQIDGYGKRHEIRPGLTGPAQIHGREWALTSGPANVLRIEREYVDSHTFLGDLVILMKTVGTVLGGRGV